MKHCSDCKWSSEYFRGLLCHWVEKNRENLPNLPAYLNLDMASFAGCFPKQIDKTDYGEVCAVFEKEIWTVELLEKFVDKISEEQ